MILVLKNADFSAKNIGQVQVTVNLNAFTESAIQASGNTSLTAEQKSALDSLFLSMGVDGSNDVMSKMRKVYLPIIAGDVSKALINYNSSSFIVDKVLSPTYWTFRNNGLVGLQQGQPINLTLANPLLANNFSQFFLRTEKMIAGIDDGTYSATLRGKGNTNLFLGIRQQSESADSGFSFGTYGRTWGGFKSKNLDRIKTSCVNINDLSYDLNNQGEWSTPSIPPVTSDMSAETSQTLYVFGFSNENTSKPYAVTMLGEHLTTEQAKNISEKIDALYDTFNI